MFSNITDIDIVRLGLLAAAIFLLLASIELLRRKRHIPDEVVRKTVHVLTGVIVLVAPAFFPRAGAVVLIAALFVFFNLTAYMRGWLRSVHRATRTSYGTVYYPLALLILAALFWDEASDLVVTSILVMAIGDAAAGIVGEAIRKPHTFFVTSDPKSVEGSITMVIGSLVALLIGLGIYDDGYLAFSRRLANDPALTLCALVTIAVFAAGWEAASSRGLDNLTVPLAAAFALHLTFGSAFPDSMLRFVTGALLGVGIAFLSLKLRLLTVSGAVATFLLASIIYGIGGWKWTMPVFAFFVLSSTLSRWRRSRKQRFDSVFEKGGTRDAGQVAANGGIAGLLALIWYITMDERMYLLYLAALAVVTADTWGTEIGVLSKTQPRSVLSTRKVSPGTSGGISLLGTFGGAIGALVVAATALPFSTKLPLPTIILLVAAGMFGSAIDSLLGATIQAQYRCARCSIDTEKRFHCGESSVRMRGSTWMNNDAVNVLSTFAAVIAVILILMVA